MFIGVNDKLNLAQDIFRSSKILVDHNTRIYDFFMKGIILLRVSFFYITHYTLTDYDRKIIHPIEI